jgi:hypothetical protein
VRITRLIPIGLINASALMGFARIFERMLDFFDSLIDELKWPKNKVREFSLVLLFSWQWN